MTEGWPDFWIRGKKIDLIDLVDTINLIKQIDTINTVNNLGTLNTLNTIGTIQKINPQNTDNVVIDRVKTINTIQTINTLETVNKIQAINRIGVINTATSAPEIVRNPDFATGDLTGWLPAGEVAVEYQSDIQAYAAVLGPTADSSIGQYLPPYRDRQLKISFLCTSTVDNGQGKFVTVYTDGTSAEVTITISTANEWNHLAYISESLKDVSRIYFANVTSGAKFKVTFIRTFFRPAIIIEEFVPEVEWRAFDVSATSASDTEVVPGYDDYRLVILDIEYESDADVEVGFRFGDGTTFDAWKFARRTTSGVFAHNYIGAPRICEAPGWNLYCRTEGAVNVKGSVAYTYLP